MESSTPWFTCPVPSYVRPYIEPLGASMCLSAKWESFRIPHRVGTRSPAALPHCTSLASGRAHRNKGLMRSLSCRKKCQVSTALEYSCIVCFILVLREIVISLRVPDIGTQYILSGATLCACSLSVCVLKAILSPGGTVGMFALDTGQQRRKWCLAVF